MNKLAIEIGARLTQLRNGRTYKQFSKSTGVPVSTLQRCESGAFLGIENLVKLSTRERVSLNWLLRGVGKVLMPKT